MYNSSRKTSCQKTAINLLLFLVTLTWLGTFNQISVHGLLLGGQPARRPLIQLNRADALVDGSTPQPAQRKLSQAPAAAGTKPCTQRANEANVLATNNWLLKFVPFYSPDKCPEVCRKGATVPPAGNYNVRCNPEKCGCWLTVTDKTGKNITRTFSINGLGQFNDQSRLGPGCPAKYYESSTDCLGGQVWCKADKC